MHLGLYGMMAGQTSGPEDPARRISFSELLGGARVRWRETRQRALNAFGVSPVARWMGGISDI